MYQSTHRASNGPYNDRLSIDTSSDTLSVDIQRRRYADPVYEASLISGANSDRHERTSSGDLITANITNAFLNGIKYASAIVRYTDFSVIHVNQSACEMFGYTDRSLMVGLSLQSLFPTLKRSVVRLPIQQQRLLPISTINASSVTPISTRHQRKRRVSNPAPRSMDTADNVNQSSSFPTITRLLKGRRQCDDDEPLWAEVTISELDHSSWNHRDLLVISDVAATATTRTERQRVLQQQRVLLVTMRALSPQELSVHYSRYEAEFEELDQIGKGGFGAVYRARNKIDGQQYAIKKIRLRLDQQPDQSSSAFESTTTCNSSSISSLSSFAGISDKWTAKADQRLIQEVKTFARISNHPNVVRYFGAWVEPASAGNSHQSSPIEDDSDDDCADDKFGSFERDNSSPQSSSSSSLSSSSPASLKSSTEALFEETLPDDADRLLPSSGTVLPIDFEASQFPAQILEQQELLHRRPTESRQLKKQQQRRGRRRKVSATLYIQMQLCPYSDLRRWLQNRPSGIDEAANLSIFRQIVSGVNHIHGQGFVHRDLKPENIFIQQNGHVYLGDFGLTRSILDRVVVSATPVQQLLQPAREEVNNENGSNDAIEWLRLPESSDRSASAESFSSPHNNYMDDHQDREDNDGTYLYTSPEQSKIRKISPKCDIYALGIILLELFYMFHTAMERAVVLTEARNKLLRIPAAVQTDYPLVHELVSIMTSHNPALRPSADEILLHPLLCTWPAQLLRSSSAASTPVAELSASQSYCSDANLVPSLQASPMKSPRYFSYERTGVQQQQQRILELETTVELLMQQIRDLQCQLRERSR